MKPQNQSKVDWVRQNPKFAESLVNIQDERDLGTRFKGQMPVRHQIIDAATKYLTVGQSPENGSLGRKLTNKSVKFSG